MTDAATPSFSVKGRISLENESITSDTLRLLPQDTASQYRAIVFRQLNNKKTKQRVLSLAAEDPEGEAVQQLARFLADKNGVAVDLYQTTREDIDSQLARYLAVEGPPVNKEDEKDPAIMGGTMPLLSAAKDIASVEELQEIVQGTSIPQIISGIVNYALVKKASDIHIEPLEEEVRIRYRLDGALSTMLTIPRYFRNALISRIKILAQLKIDEQRIPQDGRFEFDFHEHTIDIRVSSLPTVHGEKIVLRLLDKDAGVMTLEQLGVTGSSFDAIVKAISRPYGVILSTGPTGSGKTTSLYAILNRIAHPDTNVVTLEDPVEYEIPGINQSQVKPGIGYSFAEGLRAVLRQDPNVVMVGEVRDLETASMVTHAALTGHLVLTTLHTNDAAGALPRLINLGVEPFLLTSAIKAVVAQRLVRKLCVACRQQVALPKGVIDEVKTELTKLKGFPMNDAQQFVFYQAVGCEKCTNGYSGRIGIFEVLTMNDTIESLAIGRQPASVIGQAAIEQGMMTMRQDGILKALKGITTVDEVWRVTTIE